MPVTQGALACLSDGSGDAIVLVHAGIAHARMWEPLVPLLDPAAEPSEELRESWEAEETALDQGRLDDAVELNLRTWVDRSCNDPEVRALVADMQANAFRLQLETEIEFEELEPPFSERLGEVDAPVIVAVGDRDLFDFQHMAARLAGALPNATLRRMPKAGHLLALERPREIAELALAALR
jgi:3-oxoadipate enol-lactonase